MYGYSPKIDNMFNMMKIMLIYKYSVAVTC